MSLYRRLNKQVKYLVFVSIAVVTFSCYPGGLEYYSDTDVVMTNYDQAFDFNSNKLYFMKDSITHVVKEGEEDKVDRSYDDDVLQRIASHMETAGYTRLESNTIPDSVLVDSANVVLSVIVTSTKYSGVGYVPGGGGYWGYPGWGWGGYYPGYPWYPGYGYGYSYSYSYSTGSMFIEMAHEDGIKEEDKTIPIPWQATINGLLSGNKSNMESRIDKSIDQSFEQSPYLFNK